MDKGASLSIFHELYPKSKDDPDVDRLLGVLGFMPFAVTLVAKFGRKSWSSAKDLLKDWSQDGAGMISRSNSPEENMNRSIGLSVDSALVKRNPDALLLLVTLSLLPAGTCRKNLDWWAPNLKSTSSAIATLTDTALLLTNDESESAEFTTLFVLPVVQSFMAATNRIAEGSISKCGKHAVSMFSTMPIVITTRRSSSTRKRLQPRIPSSSLCSHRTYAIKQPHQTDS